MNIIPKLFKFALMYSILTTESYFRVYYKMNKLYFSPMAQDP